MTKRANRSLWQFQQLRGGRNIPIHYGVADFEADLRTLEMLKAANDPLFTADLQEVAADFRYC